MLPLLMAAQVMAALPAPQAPVGGPGRPKARSAMTAKVGGAGLGERWQRPPAASRMLKIIHGWPDDAAAQDALIVRLQSQGFGGVVCNVSFTEYLRSEPRWSAFTRAVQRAHAAGMAMWLYDERGYPSGAAGGLTLSGHPEWQARGILFNDAVADGGEVRLDVPPGRLMLATAYPVHGSDIDLGKPVDVTASLADGKLTWRAPQGKWRVVVAAEGPLHENTHAAMSLGDKLPYINMLMPEPTRRYLELTHDEYARRLGGSLGSLFVSTFTDEPSLMSLWMKRSPWRVVPWSPGLAEVYRKRRNYDLMPHLAALVADAGPMGRRVRHDFWLTVGEMTAEGFFAPIQEWCKSHNVRSGGHLLAEEMLQSHVPLYGDFFKCARRLDAPSIDCLTSVPSEVPWSIARLLASVGELEGKSVVMCETSDFVQRYRPDGDQRPIRVVTEAEIRGTVNRLVLGGVNSITSYYAFDGLDDAALRRLNEYIGRCCATMAGGRLAADVAVLYPANSLWPRFRPAHLWASEDPECARIEAVYNAVSEQLFAARRDFLYVDAQALSEGRVQKGALEHGGHRWRVVVLPSADTLPMQAWKNLADLVASGGIVVAAGRLPANTDKQFPSPAAAKLAASLFGSGSGARVCPSRAGGAAIYLPAGLESLTARAIDAALEPDVQVSDAAAPIRSAHRRVDGQEITMLANDGSKPWAGRVRTAGQGAGELWDPLTGRSTPVRGGGWVDLRLEPYSAVLLRMPSARTLALGKLKAGPLPGITARPLSVKPPTAAPAADVALDAVPAGVGGNWTFAGRVTKSNVDTFLFAVFALSAPADLSRCDGIALDVTVDATGAGPAKLFCFVQDAAGVEYIADVGRQMSASGTERSFIAKSSFAQFGPSRGPSGSLDWSRVTSVRVGWGGYFGSAGERLSFRAAAPMAVEWRPR